MLFVQGLGSHPSGFLSIEIIGDETIDSCNSIPDLLQPTTMTCYSKTMQR
jgi:hypothetical protein